MLSRILRLPEVMARGLRRTSIYAKITAGQFPAPVKIGVRASGWVEKEIEHWLEQQIERSRDGGKTHLGSQNGF